MRSERILPQSVGGRFEVLYEVGSGGMGTVYKVLDRELSEVVALKVARGDSPDYVLRLKHEFRSRLAVRHMNLVDLYELFVAGGNCCFTMQFLEGESLFEWVRGERPHWVNSTVRTIDPDSRDMESKPVEQGVADLPRLRLALVHVARGLKALEIAGLTHCDVKVENIIVTKGKAILVDFSLASGIAHLDRLTASGQIVGTPGYLAPEVLGGAAPSSASDVYSLGVTVAVLMTGSPPTEALQELEHGVRNESTAAAELVQLALEMTDRDPLARPSLRAILERLGVREDRLVRRTFAGREAELAVIRAWLRSPQRSSTLVVSGPSGIGKSRLLFEAMHDHSSALVLRSRCAGEEVVPFRALDAINDALAATLTREPRVRALLDEEALTRVALIIPSLAQSKVPPLQLQDMDVSVVMDAWCDLLFAVATLGPIVLCIDDAQWLDVDSRGLLERLQGRRSDRVSLALSSRSLDAPALDWLDGELLHVPLGPLSVAEVGDWLLSVGVKDLDAEVVAHQLSGSPLLIEQLLMMDESDRRSDVSPEELVSRRLTRLTTPERTIIEVLGVAGQALDAELVLHAASLHARFRTLLFALRDRGFLAGSSHDALAFELHHDALRKVVLDALPEQRARRLHERLALAYRQYRPTAHDSLFFHLDRAGDAVGAIEHGIEAGFQGST